MDRAGPSLSFDLSGFVVRFSGLDPELARCYAERWSDYRAPDASEVLVDIAVSVEGAPAPAGPLEMSHAKSERLAERTRLSSVEGSLDLHDTGEARVRLAPAPVERRFWVLLNLTCAALGPRLIERGALLLHAAAVVIEGRGFVLVAPEGGGKTTWADLARSAGAHYLSDDVVLVDSSRGRTEVLGTPIRSTKPRPTPPGRWPVAALLLPRHGDRVELEVPSRLHLLARLEANALFAAEARHAPMLETLVRQLADGTPSYRLTFAKDTSFMECLRTLGGQVGP